MYGPGRQEVGYILLEECEVLLPDQSYQAGPSSSSADDTSISNSAVDDGNASAGNWYTLHLESDSIENSKEEDVVLRYSDGLNDLMLKPFLGSKNTSLSWRSATEIAPFNGLISEITTNHSSSKTPTNEPLQRRSDASLLLGLALEINHQADMFKHEISREHTYGKYGQLDSNEGNYKYLHLRSLRVENVQIMFWESSGEQSNNSDDDEGTSDESTSNTPNKAGSWKRVKASLLVTFSLPKDRDDNSATSPSPHNEYNHLKKAKAKKKSKMLSSAIQLVASIIRCDWDNLDTAMKLLQNKSLLSKQTSGNHHNQRQPKRKYFFPDSLNVEGLYYRISGASQHFRNLDAQLATAATNTNTNNSTVQFLDIPSEIIASSIAPYLRAKTLHALRITNRKLNKSLRQIVPGLKLKLFQHQVRSLEWMELRERRCITEGNLLLCRQSNSFDGEEAVCGGDYHRAVTGGATVLLAPRPCGHEDMYSSLRFDAATGYRMENLDSCTKTQTLCARGGLLCDDPGLGKTITIISLILRSIGLGTESKLGPVQDDRGSEKSLFYRYWESSFLTQHIRKPALLKLISNLIKSDAQSVWFVPPIDPLLDDCPDYFDVIEAPMCIQDIRDGCDKSDCKDFKKFEADMKLCFTNAMTYNPAEHPVYQAAERLMNKFQVIVDEFKTNQIDVASKSMHGHRAAKSVNERSLVDAFEAKKRREMQEPLVPSVSTLLVVPAPLLSHWQDQMSNHVDFSYVLKHSTSSPFIYYHTSKRNFSASDSRVTRDFTKILEPIIFVDDGSKELPSASVLARFPIVLTSYNRFTSEWKNGSLEQELRSKKGSFGVYWGDDEPEASSLLKVSWLRVIVDEGHIMGKSTNNLIQFAGWLNAERTWGMTGTPTQQITNQNGLRNLYYMINFLKHGFFNRRLGREQCWNDLISSGWQTGNIGAFFRLRNLLSYLMVRHTKADLVEIPPPIYTTTRINPSPSEIITYNSIVSSARANIITTTMEGKTSGWQDSLLHTRQAKHAMRALTNMRVACCGGNKVLPVITTKHWDETLVMCREEHNLDDVKVQIVNNFIHRAQNGELSGCHCCGIQLQVLFVIPCGHLVCTECVSNKTTLCPVCTEEFDVDDFQRLQPGLDLQFFLNLQEEKEKREKRHNLESETSVRAPVRSESSNEVIEIREENAVIRANPVIQVRSHKRGETCIYSSSANDGKCLICKEEHFDCNFIAEHRCSTCYKTAEGCPISASKASYVIEKLLQLRKNDGKGRSNISMQAARVFANGSNHRPLKAIVFSEFRDVYEYFGDRLVRRFGGTCVADFSYSGSRSQELQKFIHSPDCFVMLLSKQGSVGLDLSFVTHIFFLDSIFDKSLESQVVARAYRMGATGPVHVEELVAKHSIEEIMNRMVSGEGTKEVEEDHVDFNETRAKIHRLLKSVKLIRVHHSDNTKKRKLAETVTPSRVRVAVRFQE